MTNSTIERRLLRQLERVAARVRHRRIVLGWILVWIGASLLGGLVFALDWAAGWHLPHAATVVGVIGLVAAVIASLVAYRTAGDYRAISREIEAAYPELHASLLAAVDQHPGLPGGRFGFMQEHVIQQSLTHAYQHGWLRVASPWQLLLAHLANMAAGLYFIAVLFSLASYQQPFLQPEAGLSDKELVRTQGELEVSVEPGDTEIERGTSLLVMARFGGPLPSDARLIYGTDSGEQGQVGMSKSLNDPVFGGRIAEVTEDLVYRVEFAEEQTEEFHATVFEYPRLERADATLIFPEYTGLSERQIQDVRRVSGVEGTELTWVFHLNKPVAHAQLIGRTGDPVTLSAADDEPEVYRTTMTLKESRRFELVLTDDQGRENKEPPQFVIEVLPNRPPDLKLVQPSRDVQVSPLEELQLKANAWDDYGLERLGLTLTLAGGEKQEVVLGESVAGKEQIELEHLVALEELEAEPDQLMSYHFWAEDSAVDGSTRRTASDMFFAEVRRFEEIFRQGRQPPGQSSQDMQGNANEAEELAELQKEIINATWKVIRREAGSDPSDKFAEDVDLLLESQTSALQQLEELSRQVQDPESQSHVEKVKSHMTQAIGLLGRAQDGLTLEPMDQALAAEQAAYQALLKLRAREHQVMRQRSSSGGGSSSGGNRSQQQLEQLELDDDENRYETQSTAQSQAQSEQEQAAAENRQMLSRLRELARRQKDLNERLKELQSALQEAQTEQEREEIRRQLKRLREEQQEILRDTDELQNRMQRPENQRSTSEQQQELEATRENVRQASEALEEGQVSRAVTSGTRAGRQFEDLREEFRRRTSGEFDQEMREMRKQAQKLDEDEQQLAQQLAEIGQNESRDNSLREAGQRHQIEQGLRRQSQQLQELLNRMRQTVEQAETAEPLLAEKLYDTARQAMHENLKRSLDRAAESLDRGFLRQARQEEQSAREGIGQLREGVEQAAESVLGDETEALRRARQELEDLMQELGEEIAREDPQAADAQEQAHDAQDRPGDEQTAAAAEDGSERAGAAQPAAQQGDDRREQAARSPSSSETSGSEAQQPSQQQSEQSQPAGSSPDGEESSQPDQRGQASQGSSQGTPGAPQPQGQPSEAASDSPSQRSSPPERRSLRDLGDSENDSGNQADSDGVGGITNELNRANFGTGNHPIAPLTGEDYMDWSDRLRDVEEMVEDPELRAEAARIRDRARGIRRDVRRHSQEPNWDLVRMDVMQPLAELRDRVVEELLRRTSEEAMVPIDRDPVPPKYREQVRRYYERLGSGQ